MGYRRNVEPSPRFFSYKELHHEWSKERLKKVFARDIEEFRIEQLLTKQQMANELDVCVDTYKNWASEKILPSKMQQRYIRQSKHLYKMVRLSRMTHLPDTISIAFNSAMRSTFSALDEGHFEMACERAKIHEEYYRDIYPAIPADSDWYSRNMYWWALALECLAYEKQKPVPHKVRRLLLQCIANEPKSPALVYAIKLHLALYKFEDIETLKERGCETHLDLAWDLVRELKDLHRLFSGCSLSLWNHARVVSHILEDDDECLEVWSKILQHDHSLCFNGKPSAQRKVKRAFYNPYMSHLIRVNRLTDPET